MRNVLQLIGRLTKDPERRPVGDKLLVTCSMAYNVNKNKSWFIDVNAWDKAAEQLSKLRKGDLVLLHGNLDIQSWDDNHGNKRSKAIINVRMSMRIPRDNDATLENGMPASDQMEYDEVAF